MNHLTGTARRNPARWRLLAAGLAATVAATVAPLFGAQPAAAATSCTSNFQIRDLTMSVCWEWGWVGSGTAVWRPTALRLYPTVSNKSYYVLAQTNASNDPDSVYLGEKRGQGNWGVPGSYNWNMTSGVETTTTRIARPGPNGDCTARVRHDRYDIFVLDITGAC